MSSLNNKCGTSAGLRQVFSGRISDKKNAVKSACVAVHKLSRELNIPVVKKAFGKGIVRVCVRTMVQLNEIPQIVKELIKFNLIQEIGMPLEFSYKMKSLLLFVKPVDLKSSMEICHVLKASSFQYRYIVIDVGYPTEAAQEILEKKKNTVNDLTHTSVNVTKNESMENVHLMKSAQEEKQNKTPITISNYCDMMMIIYVWLIMLAVILIESLILISRVYRY